MEKLNHWTVTKINKTDDETVISIYAEDEYENKVSFKWDGCVNLHHEENYIHICDIDDMIEKLQEIKKIAENSFNKENYSMYWTK